MRTFESRKRKAFFGGIIDKILDFDCYYLQVDLKNYLSS